MKMKQEVTEVQDQKQQMKGELTLLSDWRSYLLERNVSRKAINETYKDQISD